MNIYSVSCRSDCGSYFAAYLQSLTVIAEDKADAIAKCKEWFKLAGRSFIKTNPDSWRVEFLAPVAPGVIDYHEDSDY